MHLPVYAAEPLADSRAVLSDRVAIPSHLSPRHKLKVFRKDYVAMKITLTILLLCCTSWTLAQSTSGSYGQSGSANNNTSGVQSGASSGAQSGSSSGMQSGQSQGEQGGMASGQMQGRTKVVGCLTEINGHYNLRDDQTGTNYSLYGKKNIEQFVGQKVEAEGMQTSTSQRVASNKEQGVGQDPNSNPFHVRSIKKVGGSCAGGSGSSGPGQ